MKFQHFGLRSEIKIGCRKVGRGWEGGVGGRRREGWRGRGRQRYPERGEIIMDKRTI